MKVARHKEVFFTAAWARYAEAKPGTLWLVPPDTRLPELEQDYRNMREMLFGEPPTFNRLLDVLREIERIINGKRISRRGRGSGRVRYWERKRDWGEVAGLVRMSWKRAMIRSYAEVGSLFSGRSASRARVELRS